MKARVLLGFSSLTGLAAGCGDILGLDDNKPVFDCSQCKLGQVCDQARIKCIPTTAGAGGAAGTNRGGRAGRAESVGGRATIGGTGSSLDPDGAPGTARTNSSLDTGGALGTVDINSSFDPGGTPGTVGTAGGSGGSIGDSGGAATAGAPSGGVSGASVTMGDQGGTTGGSGGAAPGGAPNGGQGGDTATAGTGVSAVGGGQGGVAGSNTTCLTIPGTLPEPCRANSYEVRLSVVGGDSHYTYVWETSSPSSGLTFDGDRISGTSMESLTATVRVVDGTGRCAATATYDLKPRDKCWLAYISSEQGHPKLNLYDPVLKYKKPPTSSMENASVIDFKFSPDGNFLAYRLEGDPKRLMLLSAPTWQEQELDFQQVSVAQYAWSPDSSILAVALGADTDPAKLLGGVRVNAATSGSANGGAGGAGGALANSAAGAAGVSTLPQLEPLPVRLDSDLVWVDAGRFVAFHAPIGNPETSRNMRLSQLARNGFVSQIRLDVEDYSDAVQLISAASGFFTIDPTRGVHFWAIPQDPQLSITSYNVVPYDHGAAFVPPGPPYCPDVPYVVRVVNVGGNSNLQVHEPTNPITALSAGDLSVEADCPRILALSQDHKRIACVADVPVSSKSEIRIYGISASSALLGVSVIRGNLQYSEVQAYGRRRAFSSQGKWFAFASENYLYTATLDKGTPRLEPSEQLIAQPTGDTSYIDLAFSPDELWLLEQRAAGLRLHSLDLTNLFVVPVGFDVLDSPGTCNESFLDAPDNWCGNVGNSKRLVWSSDSRWAAFRTKAGDLQILDLGQAPYSSGPFNVNLPCASPCVQNQFEFQP